MRLCLFARVTTVAVAIAVTGITPVSASPVGANPVGTTLIGATPPRVEIVVSAAASLRAPFSRIAQQFERKNPRVRVRLNFASTIALVTQVQAGAPVDVFASADMESHDRLAASGHVSVAPRAFARNTMQIAVKPGNPLRIRGVRDLSRVGVVALCGARVPCGVYGATVLARTQTVIPSRSITRGVDAKATIAAVSVGDAAAALVYSTDVQEAGAKVTGVAIPPSQNVRATYGISLVRSTKHRAQAQAFQNYVLSADAQRILATAGFLAP